MFSDGFSTRCVFCIYVNNTRITYIYVLVISYYRLFILLSAIYPEVYFWKGSYQIDKKNHKMSGYREKNRNKKKRFIYERLSTIRTV